MIALNDSLIAFIPIVFHAARCRIPLSLFQGITMDVPFLMWNLGNLSNLELPQTLRSPINGTACCHSFFETPMFYLMKQDVRVVWNYD